MQLYKTFQTERLLLRPTSIVDALFICELFNTPKWLQFIGDRDVKTEEAALAYIRAKMLPQLGILGFGNYTVIRKADSVKVGTCGLFDRPGLEGIDIGFAFLAQHEKKGYAFEASRELLRAAGEDFGLLKINAITARKNLGSQKLLERLGLVFTKTIGLPGEEEDLLFYEKGLGEV